MTECACACCSYSDSDDDDDNDNGGNKTVMYGTLLLILSLYITITARAVAAPLLALAAKWLLIGRTRPGAYPLWGSYYLRRMLSHHLLQVCSHVHILVIYVQMLPSDTHASSGCKATSSCVSGKCVGQSHSIAVSLRDLHMSGSAYLHSWLRDGSPESVCVIFQCQMS